MLFVHDGRILKTGASKFYAANYNNEIVERYSYFGSEVSFLMRAKTVSESDISESFTQLDHRSFRFIEVPNHKSVNSYSNKAKAVNIIKQAVKDHEVIIVRFPSAAGTIAFEHALNLNKPVLVEVVACVFDALRYHGWQGKILAPYKYARYRSLMKKATHSIYVTNEFLQRRYPTTGRSIGCSDVVLKEVSEDTIQKRLEKIGKDQKPIVLGTVGTLDVQYKGQSDVIRAVAKLRDQGVIVHYHLVGQGDDSRLRNLIQGLQIENLVHIIGPLPHKQVFQFIDDIDVYVQPSHTEGLPRAVIEAMSRAAPCIGTDVGGIPELIDRKMLFKKGNVNGIAQVLLTLTPDVLANQAKRNYKMSHNYLKSSLNSKRKEFYNEFKRFYDLDEKESGQD